MIEQVQPSAATAPKLVISPMVERLRATSRRGKSSNIDAVRTGISDIVLLNSGEPDFPTPEPIIDAMISALHEGYTHYAPLRGDPDLIDQICADLARRGRNAQRSEVFVTAGGRPGLLSAVFSLVGEGDKVLLPEPTYSIYADATTMAQGQPVFIANTVDMRIDLDAIEKHAASARMVILCHPCNPTGVVLSAAELDAVADIAVRHDLMVLVDEAYDEIVFDDSEFVSSLQIEGFGDRLVYCQTLSKTYAMTGWRCGYVLASSEVVDALAPIHQNFVGPVNTAVQRAAIAALQIPASAVEKYRQVYQQRRDLVVDLMGADPRFTFPAPQGAFYLFFKYPHQITSDDFCELALAHGVRLRPGSEFGPSGDGYARLAFCVDETELRRGIPRLLATAEQLN